MSREKAANALPVVVVEYHHHALPHIYRMIGRKKLPFSDNFLIHLDSHPDLVMPPTLDPARLKDVDHVYDVTAIESWILPAVLAGHLSHVVWVRPPWSDQIPDGTHQFLAGTRDGRAKVSCAEPYFLSECMWSPKEELQDGHELSLIVQSLDDDSLRETWIKRLAAGHPYVLDVDLDFYSTQDPFALMFTSEQDEMLKQLYHMDIPAERHRGTLECVQQKRDQQLKALKSCLLNMIDGKEITDTPFEEIGQRDRDLLHRLQRSLKECPPVGVPLTAELVHDAGCSRDKDSALPHHLSSRKEMNVLLRDTERFLQRLPKPPVLVTVSRSTQDDYCPMEDVQFLQDSLLEMLRRQYGQLDVTLDYDRDESTSQHCGGVEPLCAPEFDTAAVVANVTSASQL